LATPTKYLFYLGHPAHYHNVKILADQLSEEGHDVVYIARKKDVLLHLLEGCPHRTHVLDKQKKKGKKGLLSYVFYRWRKILKVVRKEKPDIIVGTDAVIALVGKQLNIPSVILNEDDLDQVPLLKYGLRLCTASVAPDCCRYGEYEDKKVGYKGYQELAYLHPEVFTPNRDVVSKFHSSDEPYFILRFASLDAHHDVGRKGLDDKLAIKIVDMLEPHGRVYITSEREFGPALEKYRISIDPRDMHHAMAFAKMYIGDSQTMAAEAAVLGTPSIRFNDFVGKLSYLDELESEYGLTKGIPTDRSRLLINTIEEWLAEDKLKARWMAARKRMVSDCDDVNLVWKSTFDRLVGSPHRRG